MYYLIAVKNNIAWLYKGGQYNNEYIWYPVHKSIFSLEPLHFDSVGHKWFFDGHTHENDTMAGEWKHLIFLQLCSAYYLLNSYIVPYNSLS